MMNKLEVKLVQMDNVVIAKIIYQDESLRNTDEHNSLVIGENDSYFIFSAYNPEIYVNELFIRGRAIEHDDNTLVHKFGSAYEARKWCFNIREIINKINETEDFEIKEW